MLVTIITDLGENIARRLARIDFERKEFYISAIYFSPENSEERIYVFSSTCGRNDRTKRAEDKYGRK